MLSELYTLCRVNMFLIHAVGPDDHHSPRPLPCLSGSHQACGVAHRTDRRGGVLHGHAALHQPALQLWQPVPDLSAPLQAAPQGEGKSRTRRQDHK